MQISGNDTPVVIVTGASRGLGAAVAHWLAKAGADLTLIARTAGDLERVAEGIARWGRDPLAIQSDVSDYDACRNAVAKTVDHFGRIDSLVNNAGIVQPIAPIAESDPVNWRYNLDVNLIGIYNLVRAAVSHLRQRGGRIVNVSSGAATLELPSMSAYCTAKAGLNHFTRVLAAEESTLTALSVRPGVVDTDMQAYLRREGSKAMPTDQAAYYQQLKDNGQLEPAQIPARAIAWLALYAPRQFSGQFLDYDDARISAKAFEAFGDDLKW